MISYSACSGCPRGLFGGFFINYPYNPYKISVVQELQKQGFSRRLDFAEAMLRKINEDPGIFV